MAESKVYGINELKEILTPIFKDFGIKKASVFGSYGRGNPVAGSDVDLAILTKEVFDLEKYYDFETAMENALGINVDIVFEDYINPYMKEDITSEAVVLYDSSMAGGTII